MWSWFAQTGGVDKSQFAPWVGDVVGAAIGPPVIDRWGRDDKGWWAAWPAAVAEEARAYLVQLGLQVAYADKPLLRLKQPAPRKAQRTVMIFLKPGETGQDISNLCGCEQVSVVNVGAANGRAFVCFADAPTAQMWLDIFQADTPRRAEWATSDTRGGM